MSVTGGSAVRLREPAPAGTKDFSVSAKKSFTYNRMADYFRKTIKYIFTIHMF